MKPQQSDPMDWSVVQHTKKFQVQFLIRAHTQVVGYIPGQGPYGR